MKTARAKANTLRSLARAAAASALNDLFLARWRTLAADMPAPVAEYAPIKERRWRCDFAWAAEKVAVELDGGGYGQLVTCQQCGAAVRARKKDGSAGALLRIPYPSHYNEDGHERDNEKSNALTLEGWLVLRFTSRQLENDPYAAINAVKLLLQLRMKEAAL